MRHLVIFFGLLLGCLMLSAQEPTKATNPVKMTVDFLPEENWSLARSTAAAQGKYLLVDAYTDWCYWCKVQDKQTFSDPDVGAFLNETLVSVKLDFERGDGVELARKYRVQAYPTLLFFDAEGHLIGRISGYIEDKEQFIATVEEALQPENQEPMVGDPNELDPGFPDFYVKAFGPNGERTRPKAEVVAEWLAGQDDLFSEVAYDVLLMMPLDEEWSAYFLENQSTYAERFIPREVEDRMTSLLMPPVYQAIRAQDEAAFKAAVEQVHQYLPEAKARDATLWPQVAYHLQGKAFEQAVAQVNETILPQAETGDYDNMLNSVAWTLYEESEHAELLQSAASWMQGVVQRHPDNYAYLDTQAAVLYQAGDYPAALRMAETAIRAGQAGGEDVSSTEKLLEEIQAAMGGR